MKNYFKKTRRVLIALLVFVFSVSLISPALAANKGLYVNTPVEGSENVIYGQTTSGLGTGSLLKLNTNGSGGDVFTVDKSGNVWAKGTISGTGVGPWTTNVNNIYNNNTGNVGIGTTNPTYGKLQIAGGNIIVNRPANKIDNNGVSEFSAFEINNSFVAGQSGYVRAYYPTYNNLLFGADYDGNVGGVQPNIQFGRTGNPYLTVVNNGANSGNVGIGSANPGAKLDVNGSVHIGSGVDTLLIRGTTIENYGGTLDSDAVSFSYYGLSEGMTKFRDLDVYNGKSALIFKIDGSTGNVGIGTTNPTVRLDVNGGIGAAIRILGGGDLVINAQNPGANATLFNDTGTLNSDVPFNAPQLCIANSCQSSWPGASVWTTSGNNIYSNNTGNVGIGANATLGKLHVFAGGAGGVGWGTGLNVGDASNYTGLIQDGGVSRWRNTGTGGWDWYNSPGTTRIMALDNGGNFTVSGNATVGGTLAVAGSISTNRNSIYLAGLGDSNHAILNTGLGTDGEQFRFYNFLDLYQSKDSVSRLYINSSGNVGVGKTNPAVKLDVNGGISINNNDNLTWGGSYGPGIPTIASGVGDGMYFYPTGSDSGATVAMKGDGNVGIGTSNPTAQMSGTHGIGIYSGNYPAVGFKNPTTSWLWYGEGSTFKIWNATAGDMFTANTSGNVGIGTTNPSSGRLDVRGSGSMATAIYANASSYGIQASANGYGILATGGNGYGVYGSANGEGVHGEGGHIGVKGYGTDEGVHGTGGTIGVYGTGTSYGGYFDGNGYFSGNVGIGTASPLWYAKLDVENTAANSYGIYSYGASGLGVNGVGWTGIQGNGTNGDGVDGFGSVAGVYGSGGIYGVLANGGSWDFYAESGRPSYFAGNVGIGASDPGAKLEVSGTTLLNGPSANMGGVSVAFLANTSKMLIGWNGSGAGGDATFYNNRGGGSKGGFSFYDVNNSGVANRLVTMGVDGSYALWVNGTAGVTSGTWSGSDVRWKNNIVPLQNSLDKVMSLRGVSFDWNTKDYPEKNFISGKQIGFIAQEVEKVVPEVVTTDDKGYKGLAYDKLSAVLVEAMKEQQKQIEALKAKVDQLEKAAK